MIIVSKDGDKDVSSNDGQEAEKMSSPSEEGLYTVKKEP